MKQEVFEPETWRDFKSKIKELIKDGYVIDTAYYYNYDSIIVAHKVEPTSGKC